MKMIISNVDRTLRIPANFKHLTKDEPLIIEFEAEVPKPVEDHIAEYFVKNNPHWFRFTDKKPPLTFMEKVQGPDGGQKSEGGFDAVKFIAENHANIKAALLDEANDIKRPQLFEIMKTLKLTKYGNQKDAHIIDRVTNFINQQQAREKENEGLTLGAAASEAN